MSEYFSANTKTLTDSENTPELITKLYNEGYVFTRLGKGVLNQTRSLRIDLSKFELNSENRRILKKTEDLKLEFKSLPLENYSWEIHKLGKDFYTKKFGDGTMSASKINEMFNDLEKSNMNSVFEFNYETTKSIGYCLTYQNSEIIHYAYPFYDLDIPKEKNLGIAMMTKAIVWAKENNKKYIYLGSVVDSTSKYKLQFEALEWWDTETMEWSNDLNNLKNLLS